MPLTSSQISSIKSILSPDEIIDQLSPSYATESKVWSFQKNQHPELVVRPKTLASLQSVLVYLSDLDLDFAVRSGGVGSSSGKDVVLSMTAFSELEWDSDSETVIVGAGQTWGDVDLKMEEKAPGFLGMCSLLTVMKL
jgi:FAD/FMN-containing dehydrogenase